MCYPKDIVPETTCVQLHLDQSAEMDDVEDAASGVGAAVAGAVAGDAPSSAGQAPDKRKVYKRQRYVVSDPQPFIVAPSIRPTIRPKSEAPGAEEPDDSDEVSLQDQRPLHPIGPQDNRCCTS